MRNFLIFFGFAFMVFFTLGTIHALQDNKQPTPVEVYNSIYKNLSYHVQDSNFTKSEIECSCNKTTSFILDFDSLKLRQNPTFTYQETTYNLPFVSFDRIYSTLGAGLLLTYSIKDLLTTAEKESNKSKIIGVVLGAISGYSVGYWLFHHSPSCNSTEIQSLISTKESLRRLKKFTIGQLLARDVVMIRTRDSLAYYNLANLNTKIFLQYLTLGVEDIEKGKKLNKLYMQSYSNTWLSVDSVSTKDIGNIIAMVGFWKEKFAKQRSKNVLEVQIKEIAELDETDIKNFRNRRNYFW